MPDPIENPNPLATENGSPFEGWKEHAAVDVPFGGASTAMKLIEGGEGAAKVFEGHAIGATAVIATIKVANDLSNGDTVAAKQDAGEGVGAIGGGIAGTKLGAGLGVFLGGGVFDEFTVPAFGFVGGVLGSIVGAAGGRVALSPDDPGYKAGFNADWYTIQQGANIARANDPNFDDPYAEGLKYLDSIQNGNPSGNPTPINFQLGDSNDPYDTGAGGGGGMGYGGPTGNYGDGSTSPPNSGGGNDWGGGYTGGGTWTTPDANSGDNSGGGNDWGGGYTGGGTWTTPDANSGDNSGGGNDWGGGYTGGGSWSTPDANSGDNSGGGNDWGGGYTGGGTWTTPDANSGDNSGDQSQQDQQSVFGDTSYNGGDESDNPVLLDLSGKGINIQQLKQSNTFFDMSGSGYKNLTAWAGVGNGVLFIDTTGQGKLTQANQMVFTQWDPSATTDMQALQDVFDTSHNGTLDSSDASYQYFYVQVTNANGTTSVYSLAQLGITLNLVSNATQVNFSDGSSINGETTFTMATPQAGMTSVTGGNTAASVSLANNSHGFVVTTTTTVNADGSTTIANVAANQDGAINYQRILNTKSVTSGATTTTTRILSDLNQAGVVQQLQTDVIAVVTGGATTETVTNYFGGRGATDAVRQKGPVDLFERRARRALARGRKDLANGQLTASGTTGSDRLNSTSIQNVGANDNQDTSKQAA